MRKAVPLLVLVPVLSLGACARSNAGANGSNVANGSNDVPAEAEVPIKITTPPRPPASAAAVTGLTSAVPVGQRRSVGEWEVEVTGPWKDGDGKVIDAVRGPDSYGPDKKFVFVPVEVSHVTGAQKPLTDGNNVIMTFAGSDPANPKPEDFATNCPYDEKWPNKLDLWKDSASSGETLRGNACFIVPTDRTGAFLLGVAPFGQPSGTETYFSTH